MIIHTTTRDIQLPDPINPNHRPEGAMMPHHYCTICHHHHGQGNDWPPCGAYHNTDTGFRRCGCQHEPQPPTAENAEINQAAT